MLLVPVSPGELVDRLTILALKCERIADPARREQAVRLRDELLARWTAASGPEPTSLPEHDPLAEVNRALWEVEDRLRAAERAGAFGPAFVADARSVYQLNDRRAALKAAIDRRLGEAHSEPKSYPLQTET